MTKPLQGKVAIVTGAGRGIGKAIALAYGEAGAKVAVVSRTGSTVEGVVAEIKKAGGNAIGITCDVGNRADVYGMVDKTVAAYGALHILVNNAQSFGTPKKTKPSAGYTPLEDIDEEEWDYTFRTGATASLWGMKAAFPHLKKSGAGRVLNFGSAAGQKGLEGMVCYNATKEAIRALTRTAAREWGQYGITANVVNPMSESDAFAIYKTEQPDRYAALAASIPMKRIGDSLKDVAPLCVFLAGDGASYITGSTFMVEGGANMYP